MNGRARRVNDVAGMGENNQETVNGKRCCGRDTCLRSRISSLSLSLSVCDHFLEQVLYMECGENARRLISSYRSATVQPCSTLIAYMPA
jgi:hypothetical protein